MSKVLFETLKTGKSIVIELANSSRAHRNELAKTLKKAGYLPLLIWVQIDTDSAMSRTYRAHGISQAEYQKLLTRFDAPHQSEAALVISGKHTFATQAKATLKRLSAPRPAQPSAERRQPNRGNIIVR